MILGDPIIFGGSGGALSASDAILVVTVPTGSTVTATKAGVALTPTMWVTAADPTLDCAIFSIKSSLFDVANPWTVTATLGTNSASNTVTIDSNKQYDLELFYDYIFYDSGYMDNALACTNVYGDNGTQSLTNQNNALTIYNDYTSGNQALTWFTGIYEKIDVTDYSALELVVQSRTAYSNSRCAIGLFSTGTKYENMVWTAQVTLPTAAISSETTYTVDISSISGSFYAGLLNETGVVVGSMTMVVKSVKLIKG